MRENLKYFTVIGRIPGDDEDTVFDAGQQRNSKDAFELFREEMHDATDDDYREDLIANHGTDVFVNAIISSSTPMEWTS